MTKVKSHTKKINGETINVKSYSRKEPILSAKEYLEKSKKNKTSIISKGKNRFLIDNNKTKLATIKINNETNTTINISNWKTYKKGKGYGKKLLNEITKNKPDLYLITTDGLTKLGQENIEKGLNENNTNPLYNFKLISLRGNSGGGIAQIWRQDVINYYIEKQRNNKSNSRNIFEFNENLYVNTKNKN